MRKTEFARRRGQLMAMMGGDAIAVLPAAPVRYRNRDVAYPYRQNSDFYYLTGFREPEAVLVLAPGRAEGEYVLFCRERDPAREIWDGARAGQEGAIHAFGADDSFPITDLDDILPGMLEARERVYYLMGEYDAFDHRMMAWVKRLREANGGGAGSPDAFISLKPLLHEMRLIKSPAEIAAMGKAAKLAARAHCEAMRACRPGLAEYQIEAEVVRVFRAGNATPAYESIVGSGPNACVLHYVDNDRTLADGDLLLMDAGAELNYYASDVTRTFPVNGRFSPAQRAVYEIVLEAQRAAVAQLRPGNHWNAAHEAAVEVITGGLVALGILDGPPEDRIADGGFRRFFMHRTGHWLGMDVHDVGDYKIDGHSRELERGMVMTAEPGVYIAPDAEGVADKWRGIGVRIEDDIAITRDGHRVLSDDVPREPDAIEALMAG